MEFHAISFRANLRCRVCLKGFATSEVFIAATGMREGGDFTERIGFWHSGCYFEMMSDVAYEMDAKHPSDQMVLDYHKSKEE